MNARPPSEALRRRLRLALAVALCGSLLSLAAAFGLARSIQRQADLELEQLGQRVAQAVQQRIEAPTEGLRGLRGMLEATQALAQEPLTRYVRSRELLQRFPGVQGFGLALPAAGSYVWTAFEPAVGVTAPQGSLGQEPAWRAGLDAAVAEGQAQLSAPTSAGWLLVLPLFHAQRPLQSAQQRVDALQALLLAPLRPRELFQGLDALAGSHLNLRLSDRGAGASVLVQSPGWRPQAASLTLTVPVLGRGLQLEAQAGPALVVKYPLWPAAGVAAGGVLLSYLFGLLLVQQVRARERSEQQNQTLTRELEQLSRVARRSSNAVILCDDEERIVWVNEAFSHLFGWRSEEAIGHRQAELLEGGAGAELCDGECALRRQDGSRRWVARECLSAPQGPILILTDIDERKRMEAELAAGRELLDRSGRIGGVGGWSLDLATEQMRWTAQTCRLHDLPDGHQPSLDEALGYFDPEAQLILHGALTQARQRGQGFDLELALITERDRKIWVRIVGEVDARPGQGAQLHGTLQDVTLRHEAQVQVQRSAELLRGAIDAIDQAFALYDPQDRLVFCNERYRQLLPQSAELIEPGMAYRSLLTELVERGLVPAASGREEAWIEQQLAERRSGTVNGLLHLADGRVLRVIDRAMSDGHVVGFRLDITELVHASERAQQAATAKSQFMANMSHEIRTPLNAVLGMLALLGRSGLSLRQADYLAQAEGAARALLALLNDTLDFAKIEAGKMGLDPQPFALEPFWRELAPLLAIGVRDKPVELVFELDPQLPAAWVGDALRLQQVLLNLGANAVKFTERGDVTLRVRVLAQDAVAWTVGFEISDTGIGIAPEQHQRIFAGFSQAEASTTRRFGGTGLGLAISQHLVAQMGGRLQLESAPGQGSRFFFQLRLASAPAPLTARPTPRHLHACLPHAGARQALQAHCQALGWSLTQRAVLAELPAGQQDLLLVDVGDDLEALRSLRELRPLQPCWVLGTLQQQERMQQAGLLSGSVASLVKPLTPGALRRAVERLLQPASLQQAALPRLQGLRLLVCEDNPTNQRVVCELMQLEGASVRLADDGHQGLALLGASGEGFDAVLMDLQMPVMDGLEATRQLRARGLTLPVIGMSANASPADRHACLSAGMDEQIGKPFELDELVATLQRCTGRASTAPVAALPAPGTDDTTAALALAAGVDLAAALARLGGQRELYARYLSGFLAEAAQWPLADQYAPQRRLHTLHGNAATLGAQVLADELGALEAASQRPPAERIARAQALVDQARPALVALAEALGGEPLEPAPAPASGDPAERRQALELLAQLLEASDLAALDQLACLRPLGLGRKLAELEALVDAFEFAQAARQVRQWLEDSDP